MDFNKVVGQIKGLEKQIEENKLDTRFEKNKLYNYLGDSLAKTLKAYSAYVAGGLITSLFTGNEINDIDVYFRNEDDALAFVSDMYNDGRFIACHTKKATLFQWKDSVGREINVQVIHFKYFEHPKDIFDTFDFTVCAGAFDFDKEEFILHKDFLKHNSQRILKFISSTDFPLMSLLRVKKYEKDKGYVISKTEMMRIAMTCMQLEISSYEELKDQLGGLYGEAYDNAFSELEDEEFSLAKAVEYLGGLSLREDYYKQPEPVQFSDLDELIESISGRKPRYFVTEDAKWKVSPDGKDFKRVYRIEDDYEKIDGSKFLEGKKFYKFVRKDGDKYTSFYDREFEYKLDEVVQSTNNYGLHVVEEDNIRTATFRDEVKGVLIEVAVDIKDLKDAGSVWKFNKCKMIREVPEEECKKLKGDQ